MASQIFPTGGSYTWTCPLGVTQIDTLVVIDSGAGGGGGDGVTNGGGGGGGGAAGIATAIPVTAGTGYPLVVATGGVSASPGAQSTFNGATYTVFAPGAGGNPAGGAGGSAPPPGQGGGAGGVGDANGLTDPLSGTGGGGGGGGGSVGAGGAGVAASGESPGPGGAGGPPENGAGGSGASLSPASPGFNGTQPGGGGGGGSWDLSQAAANGADGQVEVYWSYQTPTPLYCLPSGGTVAGGTQIDISDPSGSFSSGSTVTVDGVPCTGVTVSSANLIVCTTPAGTVGVKNVVVTNADGASGTVTGGFTYFSSGGGGGGSILRSSIIQGAGRSA
jgi:IPT/TIG domain